MNRSDQERHHQLSEVLSVLRPYLPHVVVVGGWVPALYKDYSGLAWKGRLSYTTEVDVLTPPDLPVAGDVTLEALLRSQGFTPRRADDVSAVWSRSEEDGAEIEFLRPLHGPHRLRGVTRPLRGHGHVGSILLEGLDILSTYTRGLAIPVRLGEEVDRLLIRVPTLGGYVVNKATVYPLRRRDDAGDNPKGAKDLLYLRDIAAAGADVTASVRQDVLGIVGDGRGASLRVSTARNNLQMTTRGSLRAEAVADAAAMLSEREGVERVAARADLVGYLNDLHELLDEALKGAAKRRR